MGKLPREVLGGLLVKGDSLGGKDGGLSSSLPAQFDLIFFAVK